VEPVAEDQRFGSFLSSEAALLAVASRLSTTFV
jgi:hypothetical protein